VVDGTSGHVGADRADRQARGQFGVHAVHRRLVGLHPAREADRLIGRPPRPAGFGVVEPVELLQQGCRRLLAQREQVGHIGGTCGLGLLDGRDIGFGAGISRKHAGPEVVHGGQVPQQVGRAPLRAGRAAGIGGRRGQHIGEAVGFGANNRNPVHETRMSVSDRLTIVPDMITVEDVRRITSSLPMSYEVVVRDQIKFRVGQIVYVAFSRDETVMGVAFPKEERAAMVAAEPDKFMLPRESDMRYNWIDVRLDAIDLDELRELVIDGWRMCVPKKVGESVS
jgi:hypothetical protein